MAHNVGAAFETEVRHGIDLTVRQSAFCTAGGPSGSGWSTLLDIVGFLDRSTSGTVEVCGARTTVLFVTQDVAMSARCDGTIVAVDGLVGA